MVWEDGEVLILTSYPIVSRLRGVRQGFSPDVHYGYGITIGVLVPPSGSTPQSVA